MIAWCIANSQGTVLSQWRMLYEDQYEAHYHVNLYRVTSLILPCARNSTVALVDTQARLLIESNWIDPRDQLKESESISRVFITLSSCRSIHWLPRAAAWRAVAVYEYSFLTRFCLHTSRPSILLSMRNVESKQKEATGWFLMGEQRGCISHKA